MNDDLEERLFITGMWWRIGYGLLRITFGLAILKVVGTPLLDVVTKIMSHELLSDPNDVLYTFLATLLTNYPLDISYFLAGYFIFWGVIDVTLSHNLIRHRLWAFPLSFTLIGLFLTYGLFRFSQTHSLILLGVLLVDGVILWLIWKEYQKLKVRHDNTRLTKNLDET